MSTVTASTERPEAPLFSDGLGDRVVAADGATGELLQILRVRPALTAVPSFEFALRERAARLANFRHAYYARVRRIDRIAAPVTSLAIVSDHIEGTRLSDLLRVAYEHRLQLDINAALYLIRQLVPAVALLHENAREVAHGLIAPERLLVTPHGRLIIVEHVLAAAIEQLQFSRERLWQEFRVALPPSAGAPRFDHRADVTGIGLVALALVLGRPLRADEFPQGVGALLNDARERSALGDEQPLSPPLRGWLARALQLDVRRAFAAAPEALTALEEVVGDDSAYVAAPVALETFLSRYTASLLEPAPAYEKPDAPEPPPPVVHAYAPPAAPPQPVPAAAVVAPRTPSPEVVAPAVPELLARPVPITPPAPRVAAPAVPRDPRPQTVAVPQPAAPPARDITDLISAAGLAPAPAVSPEKPPLFDADAPFSVMPEAQPEATRPRAGSWTRIAALAAALVVIASGGYVAWRFVGSKGVVTPQGGTLSVQSSPSGVQVFVDGVDRGMTPAQLSVSAGAHILELRGRGVPRVIPLTVAAGAQLSQYVEFASTPVTGQLAVQSDPAGAKVLIDGTPRGVAPLTVTDLAPGSHEVVLQSEGASVRHVVDVQPGATASLVAPMGAAGTGPISGWIAVKAPFTIEVREGGRLLGTSDADRIMLAAGRHSLELSNDAVGLKQTRVVQVPPGKVASLSIEVPHGIVNLNASPWAEVWIDGQRVGETPIGNLSVPIGPHEVVFRNPQLGEKRHAISVTLGAPVRLSVDMK